MTTIPLATIFSPEARVLEEATLSNVPDTFESVPSPQVLSADALALLDNDPDISPSHQATEENASTARQTVGATCLSCGIGADDAAPAFASVLQQRAHFKSDWHRYNVKRRLAGLSPTTLEAFEALLDGQDEDDKDAIGSLSGSDSELEASDGGTDAGFSGTRPLSTSTGPYFCFRGERSRQFAVWRCLVAPDREHRSEEPPPAAECLSALQQLRHHGDQWAIILFSGGHFAAAIYDVKPPKEVKQQQPASAVVDSALTEVRSKSFHKYVVRAKAGGKQSSKDATGKYARSAGSRLRRHNEAALQKDIAETLAAWKEVLSTCGLILVAAPGSNHRVLFSGDAPLLQKNDSRMRKIPFMTRRPTVSETKRVARTLLTVYELRQDAGDNDGSLETARQSGGAQQSCVSDNVASAADQRTERQQQDKASKAAAAAAAKAEAAAALKRTEEEARRKKAEKRARQKAREREQRRLEAEAKAAENNQKPGVGGDTTAPAAAFEALNIDDEIALAASQAAASLPRVNPTSTAGRRISSSAASGNKASATVPVRLSSKSLANEDAAARRARLAAAAEARLRALQGASAQQQLHR